MHIPEDCADVHNGSVVNVGCVVNSVLGSES